MPVGFLTPTQRHDFGRFVNSPSRTELDRYFYLSDDDQKTLLLLRGDHNRLGYAIQLTCVRYLGRFPDDLTIIPPIILQSLCLQLKIGDFSCLQAYAPSRQRQRHAMEIQIQYGYRVFTHASVGFRLTRWLYALCWTGTDRPTELFKRAVSWLLTHKVLLPGVTLLERFIAQLRNRVESRLWYTLGRCVTTAQQEKLQKLLCVADGEHLSVLDKLRSGPVMVSGPALMMALSTRLASPRGSITFQPRRISWS